MIKLLYTSDIILRIVFVHGIRSSWDRSIPIWTNMSPFENHILFDYPARGTPRTYVQGVWEILRGHLFDDLSKGLILLSPSYGSCVFWACLPKNVNQRNIWRHFLLHTGAELPHLLFFFILGGLIDSIFQSEKPWTGNILGLWFYSTPARKI